MTYLTGSWSFINPTWLDGCPEPCAWAATQPDSRSEGGFVEGGQVNVAATKAWRTPAYETAAMIRTPMVPLRIGCLLLGCLAVLGGTVAGSPARALGFSKITSPIQVPLN